MNRWNMLYVLMSLLLSNILLAQTATGRNKCNGRKCRKRTRDLVHHVTYEVSNHVTPTDMICPPCDKLHCSRPKPSKRECPGGITTEVCGCCPTCAKVKGEECGGKNGYLGKCDEGLQCVLVEEPGTVIQSQFPPTSSSALSGMKGTCEIATIKDQPPACRHPCTADFCRDNPNAICSASNNAIVARTCQGECQHTGCSACYFQEEPECKKCAPNDIKCISKFAKCAKKTTCGRKKFPCKNKKKLKREQNGKFLCWVPNCL